jgi:hypothetical protein
MSGKTILFSVLSLLLAIGGYCGGLYLSMMLGVSLHGNYEYFGSEGAPGLVGLSLWWGGAFLGAITPWVVRRLFAKEKR